MDAIEGWVQSLGYSINAKAFGPLSSYQADGSAGVPMRAKVHFSHFKTSNIVVLLFVQDNRNNLRFIPREVSSRCTNRRSPPAADFPNHKVFLFTWTSDGISGHLLYSNETLVCPTSLMASLIRSVGGLSKYFYRGL